MTSQPDIDRLQAENALLKKRLARVEQELQEFAYIASHDLQEPLRKISSFGERLLKLNADNLDERGLDSLGRMLSATRRMQAMLSGLLEYSRVISHGRPFETVDLQSLVERVVAEFEVKLVESQGRVVLQNLPALDCDHQQIGQLFAHLIDNALKFRVDGVPPIVVISATETAGGISIAIKDNGIGFNPEQQERIFELFRKLQGHQYAGSGLGLSVARRIAERHEGTLEAESIPGTGATFHLMLPVRQRIGEILNGT